MATNYKLAKELLSPPGDTIQETIDAMKMRQNELAVRMGKTESKVNDIIKGKEPITVNTALILEHVLNIPASFWLAREANYREDLARIEQQEVMVKQLEWANLFPVPELKKRGHISQKHKGAEIVPDLLKFFGVASSKEWSEMYLDGRVSAAFRMSLSQTSNPYVVSAWLRMGELQSRSIEKKEYDAIMFKRSLLTIKSMAVKDTNQALNTLQSLCAECGVACVFTPSLPKAPISGAARWFSNNPLIQLSDRYRTNDHFWFAFFHEAAHVLLHPKKDVFLEDIKGTETDQEKESEANDFANNLLVKDSFISGIKEITKESILAVAAKAETHPAFIVGRLQHLGRIPYSYFNEYKESVLFSS